MPEQQVQNKPEAIEKIANILTGKQAETPAPESDPAPAADGDAQPPPEQEPELTPASLAETLGLKPAELFEQLKIPVDGEAAMTLGEFKDSGVKLRGLQAAQNELAEAKVAHENSVMLQRQTLEAALAKMPVELITEEMVAEVTEQHSQYVHNEQKKLHAIRPDLKDPAKWNATRELLIEHLTPYGFMAVEVDAIIDHRLAKYAIDNAEREKRLRELDVESLQPGKTAKLAKPTPAPKSGRAKEKTAAKRTGPKTLQDKAAEVATLLGVNENR